MPNGTLILEGMYLRAYWRFYKEILPFVAAFGIICGFLFGFIWGYLLFISLGILVGFVGFNAFNKNQYYFYYNLGITQWKLLKTSFVINCITGLAAFSFLQLLSFIILGSF